jgi:hypothetical protein
MVPCHQQNLTFSPTYQCRFFCPLHWTRSTAQCAYVRFLFIWIASPAHAQLYDSRLGATLQEFVSTFSLSALSPSVLNPGTFPCQLCQEDFFKRKRVPDWYRRPLPCAFGGNQKLILTLPTFLWTAECQRFLELKKSPIGRQNVIE